MTIVRIPISIIGLFQVTFQGFIFHPSPPTEQSSAVLSFIFTKTHGKKVRDVSKMANIWEARLGFVMGNGRKLLQKNSRGL